MAEVEEVRVKIVALSDQHGFLPPVEPCDLLIVAGDLCPDYPGGHKERRGSGPQVQRQVEWFYDKWLPWRNGQPAKVCLFTWGNHDYCGQLIMRGQIEYLNSSTTAVVDAEVVVGGLRVWLTPWSSQFRDWAFMQPEDRLKDLYAPIPAGLDILVSHQPPYGYGDLSSTDGRIGSKALGNVIVAKKPRVVVCGHIHAGHGLSVMDVGEAHVKIYNVSIVDERYQLTWPPTEVRL